MADPSPTGNAIFETVRASLKLASSSSELFTINHLRALKDDLQVTLAVIRGQIQSEEIGTFAVDILNCLMTHSCFTDNIRVIIDLSDWESGSDDEKELEKERAAGTYPNST